MSPTITAGANAQLSNVLSSLEQEPLTDSEAKDALQDMLDKFDEPAIDYKDDIDFDDDNDIKNDLLIARKMIMETIDKSKKISDVVIQTLIVDTSNPTYLQLAQEANRTIQQSVKSLTDIHGSYIKLKQNKVRTDLLNGKGGSDDDKNSNGMTFE